MSIAACSRCFGHLQHKSKLLSHQPLWSGKSSQRSARSCSPFPLHTPIALAPRQARRSMSTATKLETGDAKDYGNFRLLKSFKIDYAPVQLSKWQSSKTGLTVVVGEHATPITSGHFTIASEIFDDTGRPHTLEHLIFLGSKSYPYKGVLDHLANRAGSNGTNAWTANDHTAYTIGTAGTSGFLDMLPIYIDHILHPTITDAGFVTEVHHINGNGDDAGVVYSEMQARENQAGDLIALQSQRSLYPKASAYRSETGGLMAMLRQLTAAQIREYHSKYYVPHNLCLLIDGSVSLSELFKVLNEKVDPLILENLPKGQPVPPPNWKRPFVETSTSEPVSIAESRTQIVEFMEQDESIGEIYLNFLGPPPTDYRSNLAIKLLGRYLTDTPTSPLQKKFVEIKQPLCTGIGIYSEDRVNKNEITMYLTDVPAKFLEVLGSDVLRELESIVKTNGIDMERMERVIRRDKRKLLNAMETSVSSVLSDAVIGDFLYGSADGAELPSAFDDMTDYTELGRWGAKEWSELLNKYFVSANCLTMVGRPSAKLATKIDEDEKSRIAKRKEELGEERLKELQKKVDQAKAESDTPPPPSMIRDFPITDPSTLTWVPCETAVVNVPGQSVRGDQASLQKRLDEEKVDMAFQTHFAQVRSNFVSVSLLFDTINLPVALRPYLSLLSAALFNIGVRQSDGTVLPYETVVDELSDFTVGQSASLSFRGDFSEIFVVSLKVEASDYTKAAQWLWNVVAGSIFDAERLSVIAAKQLQELPYEKRNGNAIARAWANKLAFDIEKSTSEAVALLSSFEFYPAVVKDLESNPDQVIDALEQLRKHMLDPSFFRVSVVGDVDRLDAPKGVLARTFKQIKTDSLRAPSTARETLSSLGLEPSNKLALVPMAAIEGSYAVMFTKGPAGWSHPDSAAIILAAATLNAAESYLWKYIRGSGLAYGCWVSSDRESGLIEFAVYRSPNAREAFEAAAKLLKGLVDGSETLEQDIVDGARSTLTYDYASKASTVGAAGTAAYSNEVLKGLGKNADQEMLKKLPSVTLDDLRNVIAKYFLPLFDPNTAIGAVTVNAGKAEQVEEEFTKLGFAVERRELPVFGDDDESGDSLSGEESADERSEDGMEDILSP